MNLADTNNHRYEDQFFQFDQMQYEVRYSVSKVDHSITDNAEPDYGEDLVNEDLELENYENEFDNQESNDENPAE